MKKILVFLVVSLFITFNTCSANISQDEVALGGIKLGATPEYVKSVYGEPSSYINLPNNGIIYNYNDTFKIYFANLKYMYWMETLSNNGIATPSGVAVGMNASILDKYGEIYYKEKKENITYYAYWAPGRIVLVFGVENGKIISIKARC